VLSREIATRHSSHGGAGASILDRIEAASPPLFAGAMKGEIGQWPLHV
jgi:hypothetical protein